MRKAIYLLILGVVYVSVLMVSCQTEQKGTTAASTFENSDELVAAAKELITEISIEDFKTMYDGDEYFVMVDVRTVAEYDAGYIPGAVSIPRGVLEFRIGDEEIWDGLGLYIPEKADPIIVNCRSGGRSALAAKSLMELGYENVLSLKGGWNAWHETFPELIEKIIVEDAGFDGVSSNAAAAGGC